ncbi:MAG: STAS domain-containing protein [Candidatus Sedimenticola sp. 20ELBAFRAG]
MTEAAITRSEAGCRVSGDLLFSTVRYLLHEGVSMFAGHQELVFDLADVRHSDSAGLALLLEWLDRAEAAGVSLSFQNVPDSLLRIARLSNAEELLA